MKFLFETGEVESKEPPGRRLTLDRKGKVDNSMPKKAENSRRRVCYGSASPVRMVRLDNCQT